MQLFKLLLLILLAEFGGGFGCGTAATVTDLTPPGTSINLVPGETVYVAAGFFTDPIASIATVGLNNPHIIATGQLVTDSSDVVLTGQAGRLYAINRGSATIQVIDPTTLNLLGNFSIGPNSNPQDLVVANGKAYITRLDPHLAAENQDSLWVVDPIDGTFLRSVDLTDFTDPSGSRLPRAAKMILVEDRLYILLQDLSAAFKAKHSGKIALLDTTTDTLIDTDTATAGTQGIVLAGRNPTTLQYIAALNRIFVTDSGTFDDHFQTNTADSFGGIEIVNPVDNTTSGIQIDDADFDGSLSALQIFSETLAAVTVDATRVATFNPVTQQVIAPNLYETSGGFLPELLADPNGFLWIPERDPLASGLLILDPVTGAVQAGPLAVGALPISMTLVR